MNIEIADINTWPIQARTLLENNLELLSQYQITEDALQDGSYIESNPYSAERGLIINQLNQMLENHNFVGYHCTRLTNAERKDVIINGLELSSEVLWRKKSEGITLSSEAIDTTVLPLLMENLHLISKSFGRLWFVCGASALKIERGVSKFFSVYGGEAIHDLPQNNKFSELGLNFIGKPCIIKASLSLRGRNYPIGRSMEAAFLQYHEVEAQDGSSFDVCLDRQLPSSQVLRIITIEDPEFKELTDYENWYESIQ